MAGHSNKPLACCLRLRNFPHLRALRLQEALFRADRRSWFITNEWDCPTSSSAAAAAHDSAQAIILGISGKPDELVDVERVAAESVPMIKRFSGGGTVVVDANTLFVSFIVAGGAVPVPPYPGPILRWTAGVYGEALRRCGVGGFRVNAQDYCIGERKFGGNAQSISGKRWLHHTSLLWDYNPERMALLKLPKRRPEYRAGRPHNDFVRGLRESVGSRPLLMEALVGAVSERFELVPVPLAEAEEATYLPHRKVTRLIHSEGGPFAAATRIQEKHDSALPGCDFGC